MGLLGLGLEEGGVCPPLDWYIQGVACIETIVIILSGVLECPPPLP